MAISVTTFKARFPNDFNYTTLTDDLIQICIDAANLEIAQYEFDTFEDEAAHQLTAHFCVVEHVVVKNKATVAPLASRSIGDVSASFAINAPENAYEAYYGSTKYGQKYISILKRSTIAPIYVTG